MILIGKIIGLRNDIGIRDFTIGYSNVPVFNDKKNSIRRDLGFALLIILKFWKYNNFSPQGVHINSLEIFIKILQAEMITIFENIRRLFIIENELYDHSNYQIITSFEWYYSSSGAKANVRLDNSLSFKFNDSFRKSIFINEINDFDFKLKNS